MALSRTGWIAVICTIALSLSLAQTARAGDAEDAKAALLAFGTAVQSGDKAAVRALVSGTPEHVKAMESLASMMKAVSDLKAAAAAKFGDEGKAVIDEDNKMDMGKKLAEAEVKVEGDTAKATVKDEDEALTLKKVDGKWKVDVAAMPDIDAMMQAIPMFEPMTKVATDIAAEIKAGKFKSAEEAKEAMQSRAMAKMLELQSARENMGAATRPADR